MGIALAIILPILALFVILLIFWHVHEKQKMTHERQMLALQKGLPPPPEPWTGGPRSNLLVAIAFLVPFLSALVGLGVTIWAWTNPNIPPPIKWDITGIAFIAAGWTACIIVSTTAVIVAVRSEIEAARQNASVSTKPPESHQS